MGKKIERKSDRRKKESSEKIKEHVDVVEIERNLIENGIISLKHWYKDNPKAIKWVLISIIAFFVFLLSFLFFHSTMIENHNNQLFKLISEYEESFQINIPELKNAKMKDLQRKADILCNNFYPSRESYHACIIASLASLENKQPEKAAEYLKKYTNHYNGDGPSTLTAFYTAYAYEAAKDYSKAEKYYHKWGEYLKEKELKNEDASLFHQIRMAYYQNKKKNALDMISRLLKEFPNSPYKNKAIQYRYLIYQKK